MCTSGTGVQRNYKGNRNVLLSELGGLFRAERQGWQAHERDYRRRVRTRSPAVNTYLVDSTGREFTWPRMLTTCCRSQARIRPRRHYALRVWLTSLCEVRSFETRGIGSSYLGPFVGDCVAPVSRAIGISVRWGFGRKRLNSQYCPRVGLLFLHPRQRRRPTGLQSSVSQ